MGLNMEDNMVDNFQANKQKYYLFDYIKLVSAITVIAIHSGIVNDMSNRFIIYAINLIESCAVPFFFCITGYS